MESYAVIGDVHGDLIAVRRLVDLVQGRARCLVFTGDYVNRGTDSAGVIDFLCSLASESIDAVFLEGNHDAALKSCLEDGALVEFLQLGGAATIKSYVGTAPADVLSAFRSAVPKSHRRFFERLQNSYVDDDIYIVHRRTDQAPKNRYRVFGHSVQRSGAPSIGPSAAFVDTGCGTRPGSPLTALFWPSLEWVQASSI